MALIETYRYPSGIVPLVIGSSAQMKRGSMLAPTGTATRLHRIDVACVVTSASNVQAMDETARIALLKLFGLNFTVSESIRDPFRVYNSDTSSLYTAVLDARAVAEKDMLGFSDSVTGLARAYGTGNNNVTFTVYVLASDAAAIQERSKFLGLSPEQLADSSIEVKCAIDPFKAYNSALTLAAAPTVTFYPVYENARGTRCGVPVIVSKVLGQDRQQPVTTPQGFMLRVEQLKALSSTALPTVTVTRGSLPEAYEARPADIQAAYERTGGSEALEESNKTARTLISSIADGPLTAQTVGAVKAVQSSFGETWELQVIYLPSVTDRQISDAVAYVAKSGGRVEGKSILAVNSLVVEDVDCEPEHLAIAGFTVFENTDAEFGKFPGLLCVYGGQPTVYIPPHIRRESAALLLDARKPTAEYPTGNLALRATLLRKIAQFIPGTTNGASDTDAAERGFNFTSYYFREVENQMEAEVAELAQAREQARAALGLNKK